LTNILEGRITHIFGCDTYIWMCYTYV